MAERPGVSIVIPVFNEADNIAPLAEELRSALARLDGGYEVLAVDDGSTDASLEELRRVHAEDPRWRIVRLRRNFGQTAAFSAGFEHARAPVVVTMDADLQNDPRDIPRLLEVLAEGYDIVSGWRRQRAGSLLGRRLPSFVANRLISSSTQVRLHDYGCSLKAYRAEVLELVHLYGDLHRFIPAVASQYGARIAEVEVADRRRRHHRSKYGLGRTYRVVLDLLTVYFLLGFGSRPLHFFGGLGLLCGAAGVGINLYLTVLKVFYGQSIGDRPLLQLGLLATIVGVQLVAMGLLGELVMRAYYEGSRKRPFAVREVIEDDR